VLRVVLDTDVVVAGFVSAAGASRRLLLGALDRELTLLLSTPLLLEYETVLTRPNLLRSMGGGISVQDIIAVLDELAGVCAPVSFDYRWRPQAKDPGDDLVLETAINGGAEVIATFNLRHMQAGAQRFGIAVQRPGSVVRSLKS
jgi:putative PIN family toxin of toxin-antitoxin system